MNDDTTLQHIPLYERMSWSQSSIWLLEA